MLGVVVWSNEPRCKAVIWCEDQGDLAYLVGMTNLSKAGAWPEAGDLVELESTLEGGLRLACNVRMVSRGAGAALPQALHAQTASTPGVDPVVRRESARPRLVANRDPIMASGPAVASTKVAACS